MFRPLTSLIAIAFLATPVMAGTVKGTIQFSGEVPPAQVQKTGKFSKVCGAEVADESLLIENKMVKNAVVWLSGKAAKKVKAPEAEYILDQKKCRYEPHVIAVPKDSELKILTGDPINHNIHTYSFDNDPINLMFVPGQDHLQEFEEAEIVKVECDLHAWMQAWIVVTPTPLYALSDKDGSFQISNVPPGKYKLTIWHEAFGETTRKIKVGDEPFELNFDLAEISPQVSNK